MVPPAREFSLMGKKGTEYIVTRELSVASRRGCRAVVAQSQGIQKGPARKRGRSYQMKGMEEHKRALQAEGTP